MNFVEDVSAPLACDLRYKKSHVISMHLFLHVHVVLVSQGKNQHRHFVSV